MADNEEILRNYQQRMGDLQKRGTAGEDVSEEVKRMREELAQDLGHEPSSREWGGVCGLESDSGMTGELEHHAEELRRFDNPPKGGEKMR
jgi:hypothetical protein